MIKFMPTMLVVLSMAAANPAIAHPPDFSFGPAVRGDVWKMAQFNFRTITRNFDLVAPGGTSEVRGDCTYGNDGITRCDDCEVDWDGPVPEMICIANMICYDNNGKPTEC